MEDQYQNNLTKFKKTNFVDTPRSSQNDSTTNLHSQEILEKIRLSHQPRMLNVVTQLLEKNKRESKLSIADEIEQRMSITTIGARVKKRSITRNQAQIINEKDLTLTNNPDSDDDDVVYQTNADSEVLRRSLVLGDHETSEEENETDLQMLSRRRRQYLTNYYDYLVKGVLTSEKFKEIDEDENLKTDSQKKEAYEIHVRNTIQAYEEDEAKWQKIMDGKSD